MAYLSGFSNRIKLDIDASKIDADLTDFPVLIKLGSSVGRNSDDLTEVFDELTSDANRFKIAVTTSDEQTQCYVEIEKWDDANETAILWTKIPSIDDTINTVIYLYYDSTASDNTTYVGDVGDTAAQNVWDDDFVLVMHFSEDADGSAAQIKDSTSNAKHFDSKNHDGSELVTGAIGDALNFNGTDEYLEHAYDSVLDMDAYTTIQIEAIFDYTSGEDKNIYANYYQSGEEGVWIYMKPDTDKLIFYFYDYGGDGDVGRYASPALSDGVKHVDVQHTNESDPTMYINGESVTVASELRQNGRTRVTRNTVQWIGRYYNGNTYQDGYLDELRYSKTARTAAWRKASYDSNIDDLLAVITDSGGSGGSVFSNNGIHSAIFGGAIVR